METIQESNHYTLQIVNNNPVFLRGKVYEIKKLRINEASEVMDGDSIV